MSSVPRKSSTSELCGVADYNDTPVDMGNAASPRIDLLFENDFDLENLPACDSDFENESAFETGMEMLCEGDDSPYDVDVAEVGHKKQDNVDHDNQHPADEVVTDTVATIGMDRKRASVNRNSAADKLMSYGVNDKTSELATSLFTSNEQLTNQLNLPIHHNNELDKNSPSTATKSLHCELQKLSLSLGEYKNLPISVRSAQSDQCPNDIQNLSTPKHYFCGRDRRLCDLEGRKIFYALILENVERYKRVVQSSIRMKMIAEIIEEFKIRSNGGQFYKYSIDLQDWVLCDDRSVRANVLHALRFHRRQGVPVYERYDRQTIDYL